MLPTAGQRLAAAGLDEAANHREGDFRERPGCKQSGDFSGFDAKQDFEVLTVAQSLGGSTAGSEGK